MVAGQSLVYQAVELLFMILFHNVVVSLSFNFVVFLRLGNGVAYLLAHGAGGGNVGRGVG